MSDLLGRIERWAGLGDEDALSWSELELTGGYYEIWTRRPGDGPLDLLGTSRDDITIRPKADSLTTTIAVMHTGLLDPSDEGRMPLKELVIDVYEDTDDDAIPVASHVFVEPTVRIQSAIADSDTATISIVDCESFGFRGDTDE